MKTHALNRKNDIVTSGSVNALIGVLFFALATLFGSFVRIPVPGSPVPITLQTFFAILSGACLGRRLGALSQTGFLALWSGLGISQVWGPTGGYLVGMVAASYVVGWMTEGGSSGIAKIISSFVLGNIVIYAFGILQLVFLYGFEPFHAFLVGGLPFIAGDLVKIAVAAGMYSAIRGRLREIF